MTDIVDDFTQALLLLDRLTARKILNDHAHRLTPMRFIEDVVHAALERIGAEWQNGNIALSQVYMAGRICEDLVDEILPPGDPCRKGQPKMAICVLSDHHILGKTIVYALLRASGFDLLDFGTMEVDPLVDRLETEKVRLLLISVLMLPSALKVKQVKEMLCDKGIDVKIIVGGAPFRFDRQLWKEVGADAMGATASESLSLINQIMRGKL